jgi:AraC-like DNA-binding protein
MPFRYKDDILEIGQAQVLLGDLIQSSAAILKEPQAFTALVIDRKTLERSCPTAEQALFQPFRIAKELSEMIGSYAALALKAAPNLDVYGRALMGQHLVDLASLALGMRPDDAEAARQRGLAQARLALMKADVLSRLHRSDLGLREVAHRFGISQRHAQRLFEQSGVSFTEFVVSRRLTLARDMLLDPRNRGRKIMDIAQSSGFHDVTYFNRIFRRHFGMSPSDMRQKSSEK